MLKVSKLADYACSIMRMLALKEQEAYSAVEVAHQVTLALPTVRKILKKLQSGGLLISARGKDGGYRIAKPAREISLADIVEAMDGKISLTACCLKESKCPRQVSCDVRQDWLLINKVVYETLSGFPLSKLLLERS